MYFKSLAERVQSTFQTCHKLWSTEPCSNHVQLSNKIYLFPSEPEDMPTAESTWLTVSWLSWRSRLRDDPWLAFSSLEDILAQSDQTFNPPLYLSPAPFSASPTWKTFDLWPLRQRLKSRDKYRCLATLSSTTQRTRKTQCCEFKPDRLLGIATTTLMPQVSYFILGDE